MASNARPISSRVRAHEIIHQRILTVSDRATRARRSRSVAAARRVATLAAVLALPVERVSTTLSSRLVHRTRDDIARMLDAARRILAGRARTARRRASSTSRRFGPPATSSRFGSWNAQPRRHARDDGPRDVRDDGVRADEKNRLRVRAPESTPTIVVAVGGDDESLEVRGAHRSAGRARGTTRARARAQLASTTRRGRRAFADRSRPPRETAKSSTRARTRTANARGGPLPSRRRHARAIFNFMVLARARRRRRRWRRRFVDEAVSLKEREGRRAACATGRVSPGFTPRRAASIPTRSARFTSDVGDVVLRRGVRQLMATEYIATRVPARFWEFYAVSMPLHFVPCRRPSTPDTPSGTRSRRVAALSTTVSRGARAARCFCRRNRLGCFSPGR